MSAIHFAAWMIAAFVLGSFYTFSICASLVILSITRIMKVMEGKE